MDGAPLHESLTPLHSSDLGMELAPSISIDGAPWSSIPNRKSPYKGHACSTIHFAPFYKGIRSHVAYLSITIVVVVVVMN